MAKCIPTLAHFAAPRIRHGLVVARFLEEEIDRQKLRDDGCILSTFETIGSLDEPRSTTSEILNYCDEYQA
jgi:hypothetical protein